MTSKVFAPGTVIDSPWLNDVNSTVYKAASGITGGVDRTALERATDRVSVKDFGAKGDGVTDDTAAFIAYRNALQTNSDYRGGRFYIPKGVYKLTQTLTFTQYAAGQVHNITVTGDGPQATVLDFSGAPANSDGIAFGTGSHYAIENLSVAFAKRDGLSLVGGLLGSTDYSQQIHISNVRISFPGRDGIYSTDIFMARFEDVWVTTAGRLGFNFGGFHTSLNVARCWASNCAASGWSINGVVYSTFSACGSDDNLYGYSISNVRGVTFEGCGAESNQRDSWLVQTGDSTVTGLPTAVQNVHGLVLTGCYGFRASLATPGTYANLVAVITANNRPANITIVGCNTEKAAVNDPSVSVNGASGRINIKELNCSFDSTVFQSGNVIYEGRIFTFFPTVVGSTVAGTCSYNVQSGRYSINGGVLSYAIDASWTAHTGTGGLRITSLPLNSLGNAVGSAQTTGIAFTTTILPTIDNGTAALYMTENRTGAAPVLTLIAATGRVIATGSYLVS